MARTPPLNVIDRRQQYADDPSDVDRLRYRELFLGTVQNRETTY